MLAVPNTDSGIVFAPDDQHIYVAGGMDDDIHVFARGDGKWAPDGAPIRLGHQAGLGHRSSRARPVSTLQRMAGSWWWRTATMTP